MREATAEMRDFYVQFPTPFQYPMKFLHQHKWFFQMLEYMECLDAVDGTVFKRVRHLIQIMSHIRRNKRRPINVDVADFFVLSTAEIELFWHAGILPHPPLVP